MTRTSLTSTKHIETVLQTEQFSRIDFIYWGNVILEKALKINEAINKELLLPIVIAGWLNEPGWLKQFMCNESTDQYHWADYKKKARQLTKKERFLKAERLRAYWSELRRRKNLREEVRVLLTDNKKTRKDKHLALISDDFDKSAFSEICKQFSPQALTHRHCKFEFERSQEYPLSLSIPWKTILAAELATIKAEEISFSMLEQYCPNSSKRREAVVKFQTLLDMDNQDEIELSQKTHLGMISIENNSTSDNTVFTIKERNGNSCNLDWLQLSQHQRQHVVQDLLANKIILSRQDAA